VIALQGLKPALITCGWAASLAGFTLGGIFQGQLLPPQPPGNLFPEVSAVGPFGPAIFYAGILAASILAPILIGDPGRAIIAFFLSYVLGSIITYFVLVLPNFAGVFPYPELLSRSAISITFSTSFPIPLLVEILGTLAGIWFSERY
jgi:hypothetical protein